MNNFEFKKISKSPVAKRNFDELREVGAIGRIIIFQDSFDRFHFMFFNNQDKSEWLNDYSDSAKKYKIVEKLIVITDRDGLIRIINSLSGNYLTKNDNLINYKFTEFNSNYRLDLDKYHITGQVFGEKSEFNEFIPLNKK